MSNASLQISQWHQFSDYAQYRPTSLPAVRLGAKRAVRLNSRLRCSRSLAVSSNSSLQLQDCRQLKIDYSSSRGHEMFEPTELCRFRIRLHDDFFVCVASRGRRHGGVITIWFRDEEGNAISYSQWQKMHETPTDFVVLSSRVRVSCTNGNVAPGMPTLGQKVCGLEVSTQPRGKSHHACVSTIPGIFPLAGPVFAWSGDNCNRIDKYFLWGYGSIEVYADGVLMSDVGSLLLPDRLVDPSGHSSWSNKDASGTPWYMAD